MFPTAMFIIAIMLKNNPNACQLLNKQNVIYIQQWNIIHLQMGIKLQIHAMTLIYFDNFILSDREQT